MARLLEDADIPYMLVGAFAVFAHGDPRTSRDVDIVIDIGQRSPEDVRPIFERSGFLVEGPTRDEFATKFVVANPIAPVELYFAQGHRQREFARRVMVRYGEREYPVMSQEDLVVWKLTALLNRRSQNDFLDLNSILVKQWLAFDFDYVRDHCDRRARGIFEDMAARAREARVRMGLPVG
jgi:hypothetical protein